MSKLSGEDLRAAIQKIKAEKDKTKFLQTIELQVRLRNYDSKDKRFAGQVKLPNATRPKTKVCVIGDHKHCEAAKAKDIPFKTENDIKNMNKNKKIIKKLADEHHVFIASETLVKKLPRLMGPGLSKAGKFPSVLGASDSLDEKVDELSKTVKFQLKKEFNIGCAVGHMDLTEDEIVANITLALNFLVSLLKKNWQNVGSVTIKGTMTKPHKIYP